MKRFSFVFAFVFLFLVCAPVLSVFSSAASAPFTFDTTENQPVTDSTHWNFVVAHDANDGVLITLESTVLQYAYFDGSFAGLIFNTSDYPSVAFKCSQSGSYQINLSYYDLKYGTLLSTETAVVSTTNSGNFIWYPATIFALDSYVDFPVYCYALGSSHCSFSSSAGYNEVDPFVNWGVSPSPGPGPDPVDPSSVIRSLIPRPLGNNLVYYIADHEYLYSIFVGHPFSFETQGKIDTSLTPNEYEGEQYNQFSVMISGSGTGVNLRFTNKCQYPITCFINTYDVVDGSFIRSYSTTVNAGTYDTPSIHNYNLQLSDASTFGIYQSGFFSRDGITSYPELRISWSDTIDYSQDFFVIRQGLVTIVEGINTVNSNLSTANSTLSSISTTTSSILSQIQSFYTLCDTNFTWLKTTYYNSILQRWDINKSQLDSIIDLLEGNGQTTFPNDETAASAVDNFVSEESNYFSQFDEAGSDADVVFDEAISQFSANSHGFGFLKMILETFVFNVPSSYIIVFVSLTFGLIVMIIGRVVGNKT